MAKEKYFSMRIEDDTLETLKAIAKASKRTSSGMVAYLVLKEAKRLGVKVGTEPANNDNKKEHGDG